MNFASSQNFDCRYQSYILDQNELNERHDNDNNNYDMNLFLLGIIVVPLVDSSFLRLNFCWPVVCFHKKFTYVVRTQIQLWLVLSSLRLFTNLVMIGSCDAVVQACPICDKLEQSTQHDSVRGSSCF